MLDAFTSSDIVIICLEIVLISMIIFFHVQAHATDCRGQVVTKTKTPEGLTCTREAKLSIPESAHTTELQTLNEREHK